MTFDQLLDFLTKHMWMSQIDQPLLIRALVDARGQRLAAKADHALQGFNVGMNCGEVAGQAVLHAHIHLISRRRDDTANPRGGMLGVVPESIRY